MRRIPGFEILREYLLENSPEPRPSVICHGRYAMQNLLFGPRPPASYGHFGWERATASDPCGQGTSQPPMRQRIYRKPLSIPLVTGEDGFCLAMNSATSFGLPRIWRPMIFPGSRPSACGEKRFVSRKCLNA